MNIYSVVSTDDERYSLVCMVEDGEYTDTGYLELPGGLWDNMEGVFQDYRLAEVTEKFDGIPDEDFDEVMEIFDMALSMGMFPGYSDESLI